MEQRETPLTPVSLRRVVLGYFLCSSNMAAVLQAPTPLVRLLSKVITESQHFAAGLRERGSLGVAAPVTDYSATQDSDAENFEVGLAWVLPSKRWRSGNSRRKKVTVCPGPRMFVDVLTSSYRFSEAKLLRWKCTPKEARFILRLVECDKRDFEERVRQHYAIKINEDFAVRLILSSAPMENIDYKWESRMLYLFMKYLELERLMWNLSTLGGAYSAMADYNLSCAKRAGEISEKQMQIAAELDDRVLLARCHLYIALSAAQQADFFIARRIVRIIYFWSIRTRNEFIQACCRGIRAKIRSIELYGTKALQNECCDTVMVT